MTREEWFAAWAPEASLWSRWARPVLFAQFDPEAIQAQPEATPPQDGPVPPSDGHTALVLDLPGVEAVVIGLGLARRGYRPVPLFNGSDGPSPLIDVWPIARHLLVGTAELAGTNLPADAPPAFLLDAERMKPMPHANRFDNRWVALPQDFPSAIMLRSHGIERAILAQRGATDPARDLAHVLLRWQQGGINLFSLDLQHGGSPAELRVRKPFAYRSLWWGILALVGLRRSNVGGFGALIPEQTSGGGFG